MPSATRTVNRRRRGPNGPRGDAGDDRSVTFRPQAGDSRPLPSEAPVTIRPSTSTRGTTAMELSNRYNRGDGRLELLDRHLTRLGDRAGTWWADRTGTSRALLT